MDTSVTWSRCFDLLFYWAWWCEDMLKGLQVTQTRSLLLKSPSQGSSGLNSCFVYTNNGHWSPWTTILQASHWSCQCDGNLVQDIICENGNKLWLVQSRPAGHRRALVVGWWKLQFVLMLRERGGLRGWSCRVIQSRMTPFKLLVLSDLPLDIPCWICRNYAVTHHNSIIKHLHNRYYVTTSRTKV